MKHGKQVDVLIVGIGTDIVEIARVKRAAAREAFLMRVYTEAERAYCESRGVQRMASYAARFAGKEAVMKALGTGLRTTSRFCRMRSGHLGFIFRGISRSWPAAGRSQRYGSR